MNDSKHKAAIQNPALKAFSVLVGEWQTVGSHPYLPDTTLHGRTSFTWIEGGAFLVMRSEIAEEKIPAGIAIFGSDDASGEFFMLYFDERKVSRKYQVSFQDNILNNSVACYLRVFPGVISKRCLLIIRKLSFY